MKLPVNISTKIAAKIFVLSMALIGFSASLFALETKTDAKKDWYFGVCQQVKSSALKADCLAVLNQLMEAQVAETYQQLQARDRGKKYPNIEMRDLFDKVVQQRQEIWLRYKEMVCGSLEPDGNDKEAGAAIESLECFVRSNIKRLAELKEKLQ